MKLGIGKNKEQPPEAENRTRAKPLAGRPRRTLGSVLTYVGLAFLLCAAVVAAAGLAATLVDDNELREAERQRVAQVTGLVAQRVATAVERDREALAGMARLGVVARALRGTASLDTEAVAKAYAPVFPDASRLLLTPPQLDQPDLEAQPPIGYALLDLLEKAASQGEAPPAEVHFPGQPEAHVNMVQPVIRDGDVLGHLVLSFPVQRVQGWLSAADVPGGLTIEQRAGAGNAVLASQGSGDVPASTAGIAGTNWRIQYSPPAVATGFEGIDWTSLGAIVGLGIVATGVILFGIGIILRRGVRKDVATFSSLLEDVRGGNLQLEYPVLLDDSRPAVGEAVLAARDTLDALREAKREARRASAAGGRREEDAGPPPDITGGLEVSESEDDSDFDEFTAAREGTETEAPQESALDIQPSAPAAQPQPVDIDSTILRAYDIRGVVGKTLTPEVVRALGQAIGTEAAERGQQQVVVGRDGRLSSAELAQALSEGLQAAGRHVVDVGQVPTPVVYFATHHLHTGTGVEITGSHNPPDYNGMKIMIAGETLSGDAIQALGTRVRNGNLISGEGYYEEHDLLDDYIDRVAQDVTLHRPMKVVVDCGNGVAGAVAPRLLRAIGCEVQELFCDVDGNFPNHHPDPSVPENLEALIGYVKGQGADVGLAFDGDGDRLGVVDSEGRIIWADRQMMLYARDVLTFNPGADIIFDVKCTNALADVITEAAGVPRMWKTGHSLVKAKLKETGAPLAGEMSGHIFFNDRWYGFDDGIYTAARLLEILSTDERSSAEIFAELPEGTATPELRVDIAEGESAGIMERLVANADFPDARVSTIDGLRVDFPDGWGLVRASNTQPALVLRFEGSDEQALARIKGQFRSLLDAARPGLSLPF